MSERTRATGSVRWWATAVLLAGVALRLHGLDVHSFWYDEAASLAVAAADDPLAALRGDRHPPLFPLLLRAWRALVGDGDAALRTLPALLGIASLFGVHVVARRVLPAASALLATALFAVAPFQVWYSQELRMYSLLELGTVIALLGATATRWPVAVRGPLLTAGAAVAMGSHYFGFLVPALCAPFVWHDTSGRRTTLLLAPFAGLAVWVPWLVFVVPAQMNSEWAFQARLGARDLLELPARWFVVAGQHMPAGLPEAISVLVAAGGCVALALAWRGDRRARVLLASLVLAAVFLALAFVVLPPVLQPFYAIGVTPVAVLLVAHGLAHAVPSRAGRGGWSRFAPGCLLVGACLWGTLALRCANAKEDYRGACAELASAWTKGDAVVAVTGTPELFSQAGLRHYLRDAPDVLAAVHDLPQLLAALERGERPAQRVQVIYRDRLYAEPVLRRLQAVAREVHAGALREGLQHRTYVVGR